VSWDSEALRRPATAHAQTLPAICGQMRTSKIILTILTTITFICARGQNNLGQIPTRIKQTADSIINSTLGTDYFNKTAFDCESSQIYLTDHLVLNACQTNESKEGKRNKKKSQTELKPTFYVLKYRLTLKNNSKYDFEVRIDKNQKLKEKVNLPDCKGTKACDIMVDSLTAIDIAIKSGLDMGLGIYNDGLIFDIDTKSFQWTIKNHLKQGPDRGDRIYIDATTGLRISDKDEQWTRSVVH